MTDFNDEKTQLAAKALEWQEKYENLAAGRSRIMAKPSTRQGLIDYALRKLGAPVLEINIDDDQIDDLVDDALQLFNERCFDGVERMYLKYKFTQKISIEERHIIKLDLQIL